MIDGSTEAKGAGAYADVNGLHLYYETHGTGKPLILLHRGLGSGEMFWAVIPALVGGRPHQVITPDLQGHGRSSGGATMSALRPNGYPLDSTWLPA